MGADKLHNLLKKIWTAKPQTQAMERHDAACVCRATTWEFHNYLQPFRPQKNKLTTQVTDLKHIKTCNSSTWEVKAGGLPPCQDIKSIGSHWWWWYTSRKIKTVREPKSFKVNLDMPRIRLKGLLPLVEPRYMGTDKKRYNTNFRAVTLWLPVSDLSTD